MRHFWLLLVLALPAAAILAMAPIDRAAAQPKDKPEPTDNEPAAPETLGKLTLTLDAGGHNATVNQVLFTPDSKQVVTVSADHSIRIWDEARLIAPSATLEAAKLALRGETRKVLYPPGFGGLRAAALFPDGKILAVASCYPQGDKIVHVIYLMTLAEGRIERVLKSHTAPFQQHIHALALSADGKRLAANSHDNTTRIWNLARSEPEPEQVIKTRGKKEGRLGGLAFSPDGSRLGLCGRQKRW